MQEVVIVAATRTAIGNFQGALASQEATTLGALLIKDLLKRTSLPSEAVDEVILGQGNVNGGAIALGHPIGASGCRIVVSLVHEMVKLGSRKGLATFCIGGGQGIALALER